LKVSRFIFYFEIPFPYKMPHPPKYVRDAFGREFKLSLFIDRYGRPYYRYIKYKFTAAGKIGIVFSRIASGFR
jgi:hypothetical protein